MAEHLAQMAPMLLLAGIAAGWSSEALSRANGYGFMYDLALGIAGSLLAGLLLWLVSGSGGSMTAMFLIGAAGAAVAITAQRYVWRSARSA
jgi:uncharacterized membrane protein YeaQ/YmgE (transglycosylase-associated protein family)